MKQKKVLTYLSDWVAVWVAVFSFEILAAIAVDPQINIDSDAWQAVARGALIATGATGMWQAITWVRRGNSNVPAFVQEQLPSSPPIGTGTNQEADHA